MVSQRESLFAQAFQVIWKLKRQIQQITLQDFEINKVTLLQIWALLAIEEKPKITMSELAKQLSLSPSSTAQLVDRLTKLAWIKGVGDRQDRRIHHLFLTNSGEKLMTEIKIRLKKRLSVVFKNLTQKDLKDLLRIYRKMLKQVEA